MSRAEKIKIWEEVDTYLAAPKRLKGAQPIWRESGQTDRLDANWVVEEDSGLARGYLAFRVNRVSTNEPSVTLVFQRKAICRVDIKAPDDSDGNPPQARFLGLPAQVFGPHIHRWEHNRKYVLDALPPDEWDIPIKEEISRATQTLGHILAMICDECRIDFTPEQRDTHLPPRERLI